MVLGFSAVVHSSPELVLQSQGVVPAWDDPWADPDRDYLVATAPDTFCTGLVMWCTDVFLCYSRWRGYYQEERTPYPCGVCFGIDDPSDW